MQTCKLKMSGRNFAQRKEAITDLKGWVCLPAGLYLTRSFTLSLCIIPYWSILCYVFTSVVHGAKVRFICQTQMSSAEMPINMQKSLWTR